ncbi:MAG: FCD domain-containing protein [Hyphomicrobiaceae bacterium]|nr:FCD domain-containing protein [Hyphomicrobiaceae bacterium]
MRDAIEQMILTGEFAPGERLNELDLANRLNVSRGPVREVLRVLEQAGLVRIVPNKGAIVRKVSIEEMLDVYDVRAGFARTAGRLVATRATREQIRILEALYERMNREIAKRDVQTYYRLNLEFHERLLEFTGNQRLIELDALVRNQLQLSLRKAAFSLSQLRTSNSEHRKILDAIIDGNADKAGQAFERHVLNGKARMLETLAGQGDRLT